MKTPPSPKKRKHPSPVERSSAPRTRARRNSPSSSPSFWRVHGPWLGLALLAFIAYLPALGAGFFGDDLALTQNPLLNTLGGLFKIWIAPTLMPQEQHYWPLVYSTFWLEHFVAGYHPFLYHLDNVLLHAGVTLLFWRLLRRFAVPGAWLAAALFAVHPVHAESVAWVIERKDVLSGILFLGSALAFLQFYDGAAGPRRWGFYGLSLGLFALALLSKSAVVGLPLALGIVLWWQAGQAPESTAAGRRRLVWGMLALVPMVLLAVGVTLLDLRFYRGMSSNLPSSMSFLPRVLRAGGAIWLYLAKLLWPYPLSTYYPQWRVEVASPLAWLPLLAWGALLVALWALRRRFGRGPLAAMLFFSVMIGPALGLIEFEFLNYSWLADRFQYLASCGALALAAAVLVRLARHYRWPAAARQGGAAALLAVLGLLCLRQSSYYRDAVSLFRAAAAAYPRIWVAHFSLGAELTLEGDGAAAVVALREAMRLLDKPDFGVTVALAQALEVQGQFSESEAYYRETLRLKPDYVDAHFNFGSFLNDRGRLDEAVAQYHEVLRLKPEHPGAMSNLGNTLRKQRKLDEASQWSARAVSLFPEHPDYCVNLALVRVDQQQYEEALALCQRALRLNPRNEDSCLFIAQVFLSAGKIREALAPLERALSFNPQSPGAHYLLGAANQLLGNVQEAARQYQITLQIQPDHVDAQARLRELTTAPAPPSRR